MRETTVPHLETLLIYLSSSFLTKAAHIQAFLIAKEPAELEPIHFTIDYLDYSQDLTMDEVVQSLKA